MKIKRISKIFFLLFVLIFVSFSFLYSHGGRTDSNGGHYNRSTGEYHYHHGYGPHQHPNGICPYDNDYNTNNNGTVSNTNNSNYTDKSSSNTNNIKTESKDYTLENIIGNLIFYSIIAFFIGFPIYAIIKDAIDNSKNKNNK